MSNPFEKLFDGIEPPTGSVDCGKTEGRGGLDAASPDDLEFFEIALRALGQKARDRAKRDHKMGIDVLDGMSAFQRDGACSSELDIYSIAWSRAELFSIVRKSGLDYEEVQ